MAITNLTIEEKAKRYDEAIHRASGFRTQEYKDVAEYIFPELCESEDERIRKEITELVMQPTWKTEKEFHRRNELCAWLEKQGEITKEWSEMKFNNIQTELQKMVDLKHKTEQGEQKPAEWSEEDEEIIEALISLCDEAKDNIPQLSALKNWLKSLKDRVQPQPKQEWSEEDEDIMNEISAIVSDFRNVYKDSKEALKDADKIDDWLKSLRPQNRWKPSDEQMEVLDKVISNPYLSTAEYNGLIALKEQLKAL